MPCFFVTDGSLAEGARELVLSGEEARHISLSLRMAVGDSLTLSDGVGHLYACRIFGITKEAVRVEVLSSYAAESEPQIPIHLFMGYPKGDKLELVIEKAVELGAASITPFVSERCVRRPAEEKEARLTERFGRIARAAAGQCGRARLPAVNPSLSFPEMLRRAGGCELPLFCYEGAGTTPLPRLLAEAAAPREIAVIVGSEGGFSPEEAEAAERAGCRLVGLGSRILRCETAPLMALSCLSFFYELSEK